MPRKRPEPGPIRRILHPWQALSMLLLLLPFLPAHADLLAHGFSITYEVSRNGMYLGDSVRHFQRLADDEWRYRSTTQARGLASLFFHDTIVETSVLKQVGMRIMPLSYVYTQSGGDDKKHYQIEFEWAKKTIYNSHLKKDFQIENNAQDVQTFLLQIMRELQQHRNTMTFYIASRGDTTSYVLTQNGTHTIETPYKTLNTIELVSNRRKDTDQYRVWCAVKLGYMPVRVEKIDSDGNKIDFVVKDFKLE